MGDVVRSIVSGWGEREMTSGDDRLVDPVNAYGRFRVDGLGSD